MRSKALEMLIDLHRRFTAKILLDQKNSSLIVPSHRIPSPAPIIVTVFTSETGENWHIREQMCHEIDFMMMIGCVDFTIDIMIFAHHLNPLLVHS